MKVGVVLVCAGRGKRLKSKEDKAFVRIGNKALFEYSLAAFLKTSQVRRIALVVSKSYLDRVKRKIKNDKVICVTGGLRRQDSVYRGLCALGADIDTVLVHDGARPFVSASCVRALIGALRRYPAVTPAVKLKEAIKRVKGSTVTASIDREGIYVIQTPQGFRRKVLHEAFRKFKEKDVYDETQLVELCGHNIRVVAGNYRNIKITYPEDLSVVKALLKNRHDG